MAYSKVILNGTTLMDVTQDTVDAANLLSGETATKNSGAKVTGTYTPPTFSTQSKTVTPSTNPQTVSPDSGYDGLSSVTVNAISPTKSAQTYTPTTTNQTIASGQYLTGAQTILGDANLLAENIKKDVNIFGVTGTLEGGGGGTLYTFTLPSGAYVVEPMTGDIVSSALGGTPLQIVFANASIKSKATVTVDDYIYWNIFTATRLEPGDMPGHMMTPVFYMPASNITAVLN